MAPVKLIELRPTQYPYVQQKFDPSGRPLSLWLIKYFITNLTTVDNKYSHSNIKFKN